MRRRRMTARERASIEALLFMADRRDEENPGDRRAHELVSNAYNIAYGRLPVVGGYVPAIDRMPA